MEGEREREREITGSDGVLSHQHSPPTPCYHQMLPSWKPHMEKSKDHKMECIWLLRSSLGDGLPPQELHLWLDIKDRQTSTVAELLYMFTMGPYSNWQHLKQSKHWCVTEHNFPFPSAGGACNEHSFTRIQWMRS